METCANQLDMEFDCPIVLLHNGAFDWMYNRQKGLHAIIKTNRFRKVAFEFDDEQAGRSIVYINKERHGEDEHFITMVVFSEVDTDNAACSVFYYHLSDEGDMLTIQAVNNDNVPVLIDKSDNVTLTGLTELIVKLDGIIDALHCSNVRLVEDDEIDGLYRAELMSVPAYVGRDDVTRRMSAENGKMLESVFPRSDTRGTGILDGLGGLNDDDLNDDYENYTSAAIIPKEL